MWWRLLGIILFYTVVGEGVAIQEFSPVPVREADPVQPVKTHEKKKPTKSKKHKVKKHKSKKHKVKKNKSKKHKAKKHKSKKQKVKKRKAKKHKSKKRRENRQLYSVQAIEKLLENDTKGVCNRLNCASNLKIAQSCLKTRASRKQKKRCFHAFCAYGCNEMDYQSKPDVYEFCNLTCPGFYPLF